MYSVPQHNSDRAHQPLRDRSRRQYDIPTKRSPKRLSPEIDEVLHMLKSFEAAASAKHADR